MGVSWELNTAGLSRCVLTPVAVTPAMFCSHFVCGSSNVQKQSVSNAF